MEAALVHGHTGQSEEGLAAGQAHWIPLAEMVRQAVPAHERPELSEGVLADQTGPLGLVLAHGHLVWRRAS